MNLNKDPSSWAKVVPDAFLTGSIVQAKNVIEMAVQDIARLDRENERLLSAIRRMELEKEELRAALLYARPLIVKWAYTQGNAAKFICEVTAPIDAALAKGAT